MVPPKDQWKGAGLRGKEMAQCLSLSLLLSWCSYARLSYIAVLPLYFDFSYVVYNIACPEAKENRRWNAAKEASREEWKEVFERANERVRERTNEDRYDCTLYCGGATFIVARSVPLVSLTASLSQPLSMKRSIDYPLILLRRTGTWVLLLHRCRRLQSSPPSFVPFKRRDKGIRTGKSKRAEADAKADAKAEAAAPTSHRGKSGRL